MPGDVSGSGVTSPGERAVRAWTAPAGIDGIVFFGTPAFAVPTLDALVEAALPVTLVVSQPPRPAGRGGRPRQPPVARRAGELGIEIAQPERVRDPGFRQRLEALAPSVAVVAAFGQIFPRSLLALPALGCVNLHASLLPRWRGASPIAAAIAAGDEVTGVTTMLMERRLDAGPILLQRELAIDPGETAAGLEERLARLGAALMIETLRAATRGGIEPRPQDDRLATSAPLLARRDGRVDWRLEATVLFNRLRAFTPWPGLHAELFGRPVKLVWAEPLTAAGDAGRPGEILGLREDRLAVACGAGSVLGLERLQRPGGRPQSARDFANGERLRPGQRFA